MAATPIQVSWPQSEILGGYRAAGGALTAVFCREMTGEGQVVDVRTQLEVAWTNLQGVGFAETVNFVQTRAGSGMKGATGVTSRLVHECKDGLIYGIISGGAVPGIADTMTRVVKWMGEEEVTIPDWLKTYSWHSDYDSMAITQEEYDRVSAPIEEFYRSRTKTEFDDQAVKRELMACALYGIEDIGESAHLKAREFWVKLEHPELNDTLTYCGPIAKVTEAPIRLVQRAPLIGEHNEEIYEKELGLSRGEILTLKQAQVI